jgi:hypothetical protein
VKSVRVWAFLKYTRFVRTNGCVAESNDAILIIIGKRQPNDEILRLCSMFFSGEPNMICITAASPLNGVTVEGACDVVNSSREVHNLLATGRKADYIHDAFRWKSEESILLSYWWNCVHLLFDILSYAFVA